MTLAAESSATPLVTVVTPVFNSATFLTKTLDSALAQRLRSIEIVVINDGSSDLSGAIAQEYTQRYPCHVRYVEQRNAGPAAARNAGIRIARGRYVALLDADDLWLPDHLATLVPLLEADPALALAHANITFIDADGRALSTPAGRWGAGSVTDPFRAVYLRSEHISCPTVVFRTEILSTVGVFDIAASLMGCEDRDLWLRVSAQYRIRYVPRVTALYRVHPGSLSQDQSRMIKARRVLVEKHSTTLRGRSLRRLALSAVDLEAGTTFRGARQWPRAIRSFAQALLRAPGNRSAWRGLAGSILLRGPSPEK